MRLTALIAVMLGASLGACVTPSIPIPPPDPTEMTFDITPSPETNGPVAVFSYPPNQNYKDATVYVFDLNNGGGVFHVANPNNSFGPLLPLPVAIGDQINVAIESADQTISRCIVLRQGTQDPNTYCPGL